MKFYLKSIIFIFYFILPLGGCSNSYQKETKEISQRVVTTKPILNTSKSVLNTQPITRKPVEKYQKTRSLYKTSSIVNNNKVTNRALVIGVSQYDNLRADQQLKGPDNDIILIKETLEQNGFKEKNIKLLNHHYTKPTRQAILKAFNQLVRDTKQGDYVFIYYSGHGAQQRSLDSKMDEPDGLDELILPADVNALRSFQGRKIKNAIIDNELNVYFRKLLAKKALVWFIADSCYSGGLGRSLNITSSARPPIKLEKYQIGLFKNLKNNAKSRDISFNSSNLTGNMIAFYAVHASQKAKEKQYGGWFGNKYGVFTHNLIKTIQKNQQAMSYQHLRTKILDNYETKVSPPLIIASDPAILRCNIFKPNAACNKRSKIIPFFDLPIALLNINKSHFINQQIKALAKRIPALKIVPKSKAALYLSIKNKQLLIIPKNQRFGKQTLNLNDSKADLEQAIFKNLYQFSKINALFTFFKEKFNHGIKNIDFKVSVDYGKNNKVLLNNSKVNKLYHGDKINIHIDNRNLAYRDINLFLIDSEYKLTTLYPDINQSNRLEDFSQILQQGIITNKTIGSEILLLVSFATRDRDDVKDMRFLTNKPLPLLKDLDNAEMISFSDFLLYNRISKVALKKASLDYYQLYSLNYYRNK